VINIKNEEVIKSVGERIRKFRIQKNLSQEDLANEAEISLSQITRLELGKTNPTISTLYVIAEALSIELKTLLDFRIKK
jgi:transcriptional regulator with XRE-family HTH domain